MLFLIDVINLLSSNPATRLSMQLQLLYADVNVCSGLSTLQQHVGAGMSGMLYALDDNFFSIYVHVRGHIKQGLTMSKITPLLSIPLLFSHAP